MLTWYDYNGKHPDQNDREGGEKRPGLIARKLPSGETVFTAYIRNSWGHALQMDQTWSDPDGTGAYVRKHKYEYATDGRRVVRYETPDAAVTLYGYDARNLLTAVTNPLGEVVRYEYDDWSRLIEVVGPTLHIQYTYDDTNHPGLPTQVVESDTGRTDNYTYSNGRVLTHTDPRGLTITNQYDGLGRLVRVSYPDGTYISNEFSALRLVGTRDRSGHWTRYAYDAYGRLLAMTNALGRATTYSYCDCGSLDSITDALGNITTFTYDPLGRRLRTLYPDGSWVSNRYDLLGRVSSVIHSSGYATTNWYNLQGLVYAVSNTLGLVSFQEFDALDRVVRSVDANGVTVTSTYDLLGRLTKTDRSGGTNLITRGYRYDASGLIAITNDGFTTWYTNDAAGRRIAERNPNGEVTRFEYSPAGDLLKLIDGTQHETTWQYDEYGRVTNKTDHLTNVMFTYRYDADGRLTNRWTPEKGHTYYAYDAVGNLTNVDYATSADLHLACDALHRLTNLVDAVGQTRSADDALGR